MSNIQNEFIFNGIKPSDERVREWLMGLLSAVSMPFYNYDIIQWYEKELGRKCKNDTEYHHWCDQYWLQAGKTLYRMLYN